LPVRSGTLPSAKKQGGRSAAKLQHLSSQQRSSGSQSNAEPAFGRNSAIKKKKAATGGKEDDDDDDDDDDEETGLRRGLLNGCLFWVAAFPARLTGWRP
jgi:hypothetical protein